MYLYRCRKTLEVIDRIVAFFSLPLGFVFGTILPLDLCIFVSMGCDRCLPHRSSHSFSLVPGALSPIACVVLYVCTLPGTLAGHSFTRGNMAPRRWSLSGNIPGKQMDVPRLGTTVEASGHASGRRLGLGRASAASVIGWARRAPAGR